MQRGARTDTVAVAWQMRSPPLPYPTVTPPPTQCWALSAIRACLWSSATTPHDLLVVLRQHAGSSTTHRGGAAHTHAGAGVWPQPAHPQHNSSSRGRVHLSRMARVCGTAPHAPCSSTRCSDGALPLLAARLPEYLCTLGRQGASRRLGGSHAPTSCLGAASPTPCAVSANAVCDDASTAHSDLRLAAGM
jgi:hypothetical protein